MGVVVFYAVIEDDMKIAFRARKPFSPLHGVTPNTSALDLKFIT